VSESDAANTGASVDGGIAKDAQRGPSPGVGASVQTNKARVVIAVGVALAAAVALLALQAFGGHVPRAPLIGALLALVAGASIASLLRAPTQIVAGPPAWLAAEPGESRFMAPLFTVPVALAIAVLGALFFGYPAMPLVAALALAALLPSALRRPGLFATVVVAFIYLPNLGSYGLWDPWETHYGEVAREILERKDWISLWWAQENWFWSKPILIFWSEAFTMGALGVSSLPDGNPENAEWALRLPVFVGAMGGLAATYALIKRGFSARAGAFAVLVVATVPHFFFLAHQAITDMHFVANMMMAVSLLGFAITSSPDDEARGYRVLGLPVSLQHLIVVAFVAAVLPQATYLVSRNLTIDAGGSLRVSFHPDRFLYGSAGNKGVPGNDAPRDTEPALDAWAVQPISQGALWIVLLGLLVWWLWRERRVQPLFMQGFYFFCALAFMGKGIPGIALPGLVALLYLVVSGRWSLLIEGRLAVARGVLSTALVALPWFVAMYMRHGPRFTDRLLIHDHINRLASGVHGDTGSIEYFFEQMSYGMFPWIALVPAAAGLWFWYQRERDVPDARRQVLLLYTLWFAGAFTLFNAMVTKFHHYIFPAEPAAAVLVALTLDYAIRDERATKSWALTAFFAAAASVLVALGVGALRGDLRGVIPEGVAGNDAARWVLDHKPSVAVGAGLLAAGIAVFVAAWWVLRRALAPGDGASGAEAAPGHSAPSAEGAPWRDDAGIKVAFVTGAVLLAFVARDFAWKPAERPYGYEKLLQLFVYNYKRAWPEQFDYRPVLFGFGLTAAVLLVLLAVRSLRSLTVPAFIGLALGFTAWTLNVYMLDVSPHWGQRELIQKYYEVRKGPEEPLLAYQMNWKGENFYTGNRAYVFVKLDTKLLKDWVKKNAGKHCYAILEHGRVSAFKGHVRGGVVKELTTKRENNKFVLLDVSLPKVVAAPEGDEPKSNEEEPSARP
jgi:4-amino-4-deoxy-L-arabinose transferase-like glycosyltransferase